MRFGAEEGVLRETVLPASQRRSQVWHLRQLLQVQPNSEIPCAATLVLEDSGVLNKVLGISKGNLSQPGGSDLHQLESTFSLWTDLLLKGEGQGTCQFLSTLAGGTHTHTHTQEERKPAREVKGSGS